jgi:hypothetical protein
MEGEEMRKAVVLVIALVLVSACATGVSAEMKGKYLLSIPLSVVVPTGDLAEVSSAGWGFGFGIGYWITDSWLIDGMVSYHNFGEKEVTDGVEVDGATAPIEFAVAYYFMKDSKYRPYATFRVGYMNFEGDFREEWELGQKNAACNSLGIGMAFLRGEHNEAMLFVEPNVWATYAEETVYYWSVSFGMSWNFGG